jgi:hypothetical protein
MDEFRQFGSIISVTTDAFWHAVWAARNLSEKIGSHSQLRWKNNEKIGSVWNQNRRYFLRRYLKHEQACFIRYKHKAIAESFVFDKAQTAGVWNDLKNNPSYEFVGKVI